MPHPLRKLWGKYDTTFDYLKVALSFVGSSIQVHYHKAYIKQYGYLYAVCDDDRRGYGEWQNGSKIIGDEGILTSPTFDEN